MIVIGTLVYWLKFHLHSFPVGDFSVGARRGERGKGDVVGRRPSRTVVVVFAPWKEKGFKRKFTNYRSKWLSTQSVHRHTKDGNTGNSPNHKDNNGHNLNLTKLGSAGGKFAVVSREMWGWATSVAVLLGLTQSIYNWMIQQIRRVDV